MTRQSFKVANLLRWRTLRWVPLAAALPALWACNARPFEAPNPRPEQESDLNVPVNPTRDLDLLFVVDNSNSMEEEQTNLRKNFPAFMKKLRDIPGGLPNVHIAVISTDMGAGNFMIPGNPQCSRTPPGGDRGNFRVKPDCGLQAGARFIISRSNGTENNFTGTLEQTFACLAELGIGGCGYEHQLQAMRFALAENLTPDNAGFLRPNAFLAIVHLTDEDDCSTRPETDVFVDSMSYQGQAASLRCGLMGHECKASETADYMPVPAEEFSTALKLCRPDPTPSRGMYPVQEFVDYVRGLKARFPERIVVSAIAGWPINPDGASYTLAGGTTSNPLDVEPACTYDKDDAAPAIRLKSFVDAFGENGRFEVICQPDLTKSLEKIASLIASKIDPGCLDARPVDIDAKTDGVQSECVVVDREPTSSGGTNEKIRPECDANASNTPCWRMLAPGANGNSCTDDKYRVVVERGDKTPPPDTILAIKCRTCARTGVDQGCGG
jgi:hypothetical protein